MKSFSSTPKSKQKYLQPPSLIQIHLQLVQMEKNIIVQRKKIISEGKKQLNRSWRSLCKILKSEEKQKHNQQEQQILDSCLNLIIKQRISLQRENLQIEKLRSLCKKNWNSPYSSAKKKINYRTLKARKEFKL